MGMGEATQSRTKRGEVWPPDRSFRGSSHTSRPSSSTTTSIQPTSLTPKILRKFEGVTSFPTTTTEKNNKSPRPAEEEEQEETVIKGKNLRRAKEEASATTKQLLVGHWEGGKQVKIQKRLQQPVKSRIG
mmetsp:Transcript_10903/g.16198  ORF Transcript_10903/g.16198 Transcript_10903/m.16198 type:complete len:130 (-) Transcript_10903:65-454(-)